VFNTKTSNANNTVINCNNHTVFATDGGTFVDIVNASRVKVLNCYLKNFEMPIKDAGSSTTIANDTIANSNISILVHGGNESKFIYNRIENATTALSISGENTTTVMSNNITGVVMGLLLNGDFATIASENHITNAVTALSIMNSTSSKFENNTLSGHYGIVCDVASSSSTSNNGDNGGNVCSSNSKCYWMTLSNMCRAS
jgi:hypothetical protein